MTSGWIAPSLVAAVLPARDIPNRGLMITGGRNEIEFFDEGAADDYRIRVRISAKFGILQPLSGRR